MASDVNTSARLLADVRKVSDVNVTSVDHMEFTVTLPEGDSLTVATNLGRVTVAHVMPSGNVRGQAEFSGLSYGLVSAAIVGMVADLV